MPTFVFSSMDEETTIETFEVVRCILGDTHEGMKWIFNRAIVHHPGFSFPLIGDNPTNTLVNVSLAIFGVSFIYKACKEITDGTRKKRQVQIQNIPPRSTVSALVVPEHEFEVVDHVIDDKGQDKVDDDSSDGFDKIGATECT